MKDFFVSYTGTDTNYATWVAELLESNQYSVTIQAWDFKPGDNFVSKINEALLELSLIHISQNLNASGKVKIMLWDILMGMKPLCAANGN